MAKKSSSSITSRFALYNFAGKPTAWFGVEAVDLGSQAKATVKKEPSHHIIVADRSGSMYYDIPEMRTILEKLLTLSEFANPDLRVSLISTSSTGDLTTHFARVLVADIMKTGSPHLQAIRNLQATGATCLSQGLARAESLVDDGDVTCISFHSDGYANDRSPTDEKRLLQEISLKLKKHPKVFVNTIAYRDYCDFNLLSSIANQLSGTCIQAKGIKQVYEALHSATELLAGKVAPAIEIPLGNAAYTLFVSKSAKKVLGSAESMLVQGLAEGDDKTAYRLHPMTESEYDKSKIGIAEATPILAYARAMLSEGMFNRAKYAMVSSRIKSLIDDHARALTANEIAVFASSLEILIASDESGLTTMAKTAKYGIERKGPTVLDVLAALGKYPNTVSVDINALMKNYTRRGVKSIPGTRGADGKVTPPSVDTKNRDDSSWVEVRSFEFNNANATINMLTARPVDLIERTTKKVIPSVAGVKLDTLQEFRNYTIVGDGTLTVPSLSVRFSDKRAHRAVADLGLAAVFGEYSHATAHTISFERMPVIKYDFGLGDIPLKGVQTMIELTVLSKILAGVSKATAGEDRFSPDQIAKLKDHFITPSGLNFSPPSTVPYADLKEAINTGLVDTRLSYKVTIGTPECLQLGDLYSGNEYLDRRFTFDGGKPTLSMLMSKGEWGDKKLTARTKLNSIDAIAHPIYEDVIFQSNGKVTKLLADIGVSVAERENFFSTLRRDPTADGDPVTVINNMRHSVDDAIEAVYEGIIRPLVFYIGSTGLLPDGLLVTVMSADQLVAKFPNLSPGKKEKEGTFFVLPNNVIVGVYTEQAHFSTEAGAKAAASA